VTGGGDWDPLEDRFLRRIRRQDITFDALLGRDRPQSGCFSDDSDGSGMSAFSMWHLQRLRLESSDVLRGYSGFVLVAIPGRLLIDTLSQTIRHAPTDDLLVEGGIEMPHPCNDAHVEVIGHKGKPLQKAVRKIPFLQ
jgi:hypothetical protein